MKLPTFLLVMAFTILLLQVVSATATIPTIPPTKQFSCTNLLQNNNGTFANITSISYPNGTFAFVGQIAMTRNNNIYNYSFCNTTDIGTYQVNGLDNDVGVWAYPFDVTADGTQVTIQQGILYTVMFAIALFFFLLTLALAIYLPSKNKRDEMTGYIIAVENLKYLKYFCWCMAYLMLMVMAYFSWHISYDILNVLFIANISRFVFYFLAFSTAPLFIITVFVMIANKVKDDKIHEMLMRGFKIT